MNAADIESLRAFYVGSRQQLYTYAVSITGNRELAEDAVHSVLERLLRGRRLPEELRPYVFRAVRNAALDAVRRTKVRTESIRAMAAGTDTPDTVRPDDLEPLLRRLSDDERETILLKIHGGLTFHEIASLCGQPVPTVASWYRRGLERLRTLLNPER